MENGKKIDFEFRIIGDRRGGQHAIIQWMFSQFNGAIFRRNNAFHHHDVFKLSGYPDMKNFKSQSGSEENNFVATVVNYEDKTLKIVEDYGHDQYSKERYDIIILRDPYNLFSSKARAYRKWKKGVFDIELYNILVGRWKEKARAVLNKESYFINYNKWFSDECYRRDILKWFPKGVFAFTDSHLNIIPDGWGKSSFTGREFKYEANKMNVLKRYEEMKDHPMVKLIIEDKEVGELSNKIFGEII